MSVSVGFCVFFVGFRGDFVVLGGFSGVFVVLVPFRAFFEGISFLFLVFLVVGRASHLYLFRTA